MCIDNISRFYSVLTDDKEILIYGARKPDAAGNAAGRAQTQFMAAVFPPHGAYLS